MRKHISIFAKIFSLLFTAAACTLGGGGSGLLPLYDEFFTLGNPIVSQKYTADPAICVFNNRVYVYMSHDLDGQSSYVMNDMTIVSSDDLANWTDHLEPFTVPQCASWAAYAWAPAVVFRNSTYYLYFGNGANGIGVVTSDNPTGPWSDPLGQALVTRSTPGASGVQWCFDPAVFVDDDDQAYLYFGGGGPGNSRVIKLNADMISVSGFAQEISPAPPHYFEAPYMHKRNGKYYFSYSSDFSAGAARIDYMMSDNPMTGFVYKGTIFDGPPDNGGNNNHASIVEWNGGWSLAYHNRRQALLDYGDPGYMTYHRSVCLDALYYNPDGAIAKVIPTEAGAAQLEYLNPYSTVQAESMHRQYGTKTAGFAGGIVAVRAIDDGDLVKYKGADFGAAGASSLEASVSGATGGSIELHLDMSPSGGVLVGSCDIPPTGSEIHGQPSTAPSIKR
ncbi:MAG: family 43 glycosylhydrolase [Spirochaetales bacterium]|nr:family 43 glycosylhydrolase [Spirochaetales bacterium]